MMMEAEEVFETSDLRSEVTGGGSVVVVVVTREDFIAYFILWRI
jgi:hypothetical protein